MRATGMPALRSLRDLQHVKFVLPRRSGSRSIQSGEMQETRGSIPGGFLETVVRRQILQARRTEEYVLVVTGPHWVYANSFYRLSEDREGHFRFLDLSAELRNIIYDMLLVIPGTTFPVTESLTTTKSRKGAVPGSALNLLCVSRQIHREAYAHFYSQNHLHSPHLSPCKRFFSTLGTPSSTVFET